MSSAFWIVLEVEATKELKPVDVKFQTGLQAAEQKTVE